MILRSVLNPELGEGKGVNIVRGPQPSRTAYARRCRRRAPSIRSGSWWTWWPMRNLFPGQPIPAAPYDQHRRIFEDAGAYAGTGVGLGPAGLHQLLIQATRRASRFPSQISQLHNLFDGFVDVNVVAAPED